MIKVQSSKFKVQSSGFTLIELLVAVAVLGLVVLAGTSLFFTSLKSKRKTESLTIIKQSGDYAIQVMSTMIRNAKEVSCSGSGDSITIINPDGSTTNFVCSNIDNKITFDSNDLVSDYVANCDSVFVCDTAANPPVVTIEFTLEKGTLGDILGYASQNFKTTVSLRTY